jgi:hypothetical protein
LVFIPSISISEKIRNKTRNFQTFQNTFLSIIHQLIDPDLHILYISPILFSKKEILQHEELLENFKIKISIFSSSSSSSSLSLSSLPTSISKNKKRLHFITPENITKLPSKIGLSEALYYTSSAIRRTKILIRKFSSVFYVPVSFTENERNICNLFHIPYLSGDFTISHNLQSKSFTKKVRARTVRNVNLLNKKYYSLHAHGVTK